MRIAPLFFSALLLGVSASSPAIAGAGPAPAAERASIVNATVAPPAAAEFLPAPGVRVVLRVAGRYGAGTVTSTVVARPELPVTVVLSSLELTDLLGRPAQVSLVDCYEAQARDVLAKVCETGPDGAVRTLTPPAVVIGPGAIARESWVDEQRFPSGLAVKNVLAISAGPDLVEYYGLGVGFLGARGPKGQWSVEPISITGAPARPAPSWPSTIPGGCGLPPQPKLAESLVRTAQLEQAILQETRLGSSGPGGLTGAHGANALRGVAPGAAASGASGHFGAAAAAPGQAAPSGATASAQMASGAGVTAAVQGASGAGVTASAQGASGAGVTAAVPASTAPSAVAGGSPAGAASSAPYAPIAPAFVDQPGGVPVAVFVRPRAEVYIDGQYAGPTPVREIRLTPGRHQVRLINDALKVDYKAEKVVSPSQNGQTQEFHFLLEATP
jgi:hypothetical protein